MGFPLNAMDMDCSLARSDESNPVTQNCSRATFTLHIPLFTNPLTAWPLVLTASLPKQKLSRAKSRQLRRLCALQRYCLWDALCQEGRGPEGGRGVETLDWRTQTGGVGQGLTLLISVRFREAQVHYKHIVQAIF